MRFNSIILFSILGLRIGEQFTHAVDGVRNRIDCHLEVIDEHVIGMYTLIIRIYSMHIDLGFSKSIQAWKKKLRSVSKFTDGKKHIYYCIFVGHPNSTFRTRSWSHMKILHTQIRSVQWMNSNSFFWKKKKKTNSMLVLVRRRHSYEWRARKEEMKRVAVNCYCRSIFCYILFLLRYIGRACSATFHLYLRAPNENA